LKLLLKMVPFYLIIVRYDFHPIGHGRHPPPLFPFALPAVVEQRQFQLGRFQVQNGWPAPPLFPFALPAVVEQRQFQLGRFQVQNGLDFGGRAYSNRARSLVILLNFLYIILFHTQSFSRGDFYSLIHLLSPFLNCC
jgi:hypothetical protein